MNSQFVEQRDRHLIRLAHQIHAAALRVDHRETPFERDLVRVAGRSEGVKYGPHAGDGGADACVNVMHRNVRGPPRLARGVISSGSLASSR